MNESSPPRLRRYYRAICRICGSTKCHTLYPKINNRIHICVLCKRELFEAAQKKNRNEFLD